MHLCRNLLAAVAASVLFVAQPVFAETPEPNGGGPDAAAAGTKHSKEAGFPVPTASDGAELLAHENVQFTADLLKPIPDISSVVQSAYADKNAASMFIAHMMYRDHVGDITYYADGKKQPAERSAHEIRREMLRLRNLSSQAEYELASLASDPSVLYKMRHDVRPDDPEFLKGLEYLKNAAAHGYGNAEYMLGLVYFNGVGVKQNKSNGFSLLVRAAAHGVVNAYYAIGMIYEMGLNGPKDPAKSLYWLEKAARFGSRDAIFVLAMKYADGIDVPKDENKAAELEKLDTQYHAWTKLHADYKEIFTHRFCAHLLFDMSYIGETILGEGVDGFDIHYKFDLSAYGEEWKRYFEKLWDAPEAFEYVLDYPISYRMAALWLKGVARLDRENTFLLRAQTHHLVGCHGDLDETTFENDLEDDCSDHSVGAYQCRDEQPESYLFTRTNQHDDYHYDEYPHHYKMIASAIEDYKLNPKDILQWLTDKADSGDKDACETLACLYELDDESLYKLAEGKNDKDGSDAYRDYYDYIHGADYRCENRRSFREFAGLFGLNKDLSKPMALERLRKAFEYYEKGGFYASAARAAEIIANDLKNSDYTVKTNDPDKIEWFTKTLDLSGRGYDDAVQKGDYVEAALFAEKAVKLSFKLGDETKKSDWLAKTLDAYQKQNREQNAKLLDRAEYRFDNTVSFAQLVENDKQTSHNIKDSTLVYKEALRYALSTLYMGRMNPDTYCVLQHCRDRDYLSDVERKLIFLASHIGEMNYPGAAFITNNLIADSEIIDYKALLSYTKNIMKCRDVSAVSDNKALASEAYMRLYEFASYYKAKDEDKYKSAILFADHLIREMPKIDFQESIENTIRAEKDKSPGEFFVIQKVLLPCRDNWQCIMDDGECFSVECDISEFYRDAITKAITAITALNLATSSLNLDLIRNTFYYFAIYKGNNAEYKQSLREMSAVYNAFLYEKRTPEGSRIYGDDDDYNRIYEENLSLENQNQLFHIWYLRQIPEAAAEYFKTLNASKSWRVYTNEASVIVKQNEQLRTAFGYDPAKPMQRFE